MRGRGQLLAAALAVLAVAAGGVYLEREVGPRPLAPAAPGRAPSGAWLCPHGGGPGWSVGVILANPGEDPVLVRLTSLSGRRAGEPQLLEVPAGRTLRADVPAGAREAATYVEYFGGWVAAGWVAHAGGKERGVAAEACSGTPARSLILPDGETERGEETFLVVMNPFALDAVLTVTLLTEDGPPVTTKEWSDVVLPARRAAVFHVNEVKLGERTVSAVVDVGVGRVAAASLVFSGERRQVRSAVGVPAATGRVLLPGAGGSGQSELVVTAVGEERDARFGVSVLGSDGPTIAEGLEEVAQAPSSARTYPVLAQGAATFDVHAEAGAPAVAAVRRSTGPSGDRSALPGAAAPARAWVVLPAVAGRPAHPRVVLANPGSAPVTVTLVALPGGGAVGPGPIVVEVPGGSTVAAPAAFVEALPGAAVLAVADDGTFVAASASNSLGRRGSAAYAAALGVPVPGRWIPERPG
jgi:hypothetical protein